MRRVLIGVIASTMLLAVGQARGDSIAFYNETNHVRGGVDKLFNSLTNPTDSITKFDDGDGTNIYGDWFDALNSADILVLPSLKDQSARTLETTLGVTRQLVENFVYNGGGLIALGSPMFGSIFPSEFSSAPQGSYSTWFLNKVFNGEGSSSAFSLIPEQFADRDYSLAKETTKRLTDAPFNDDPGVLPNINSTSLLYTSSLPGYAWNVYSDGWPRSSVFVAEYGSGRIAFLGFDWFTGDLLEAAGWNQVLDSAVEYVRPEEVNVVPEPMTLALWQLGAAGVVLAIRRRRRK